jgi:hypothetical protein
MTLARMNHITLCLLAPLSIAIVACGEDRDEPGPWSSAPQPPTSLSELEWRSCGSARGRDIECAELEVPVSEETPELGSLQLAMNRVRAEESFTRRGALFVNPGGPGASGKEFVAQAATTRYFDTYAPGFDIIGFDPRGVADSGSVPCRLPSVLPPNAGGLRRQQPRGEGYGSDARGAR